MNNTSETTILEEGDVKITNLRAVIGTITYPMLDVTSVRMTKAGSVVGCVIAALINGGLLLGLYSFLGDTNNSQYYCLNALVCLGSAIVVAFTASPNYIIQIRGASGQADILQSMDKDYLERIVDAINDAIEYELMDDEVKAAVRA